MHFLPAVLQIQLVALAAVQASPVARKADNYAANLSKRSPDILGNILGAIGGGSTAATTNAATTAPASTSGGLSSILGALGVGSSAPAAAAPAAAAPATAATQSAATGGAPTGQAQGAVGPQLAPGTPAPNTPPPPPAAGAMNKLVAAALVPPPQGPDASTPPPVAMIQTGQQISQILQMVAPPVAGVDGATACNEFVGYFSTVSASLNSMFTAQDPPTIQRRAAMAYIAENNEAYAASNMFNIAMNSNNQAAQQMAVQAMQLILLNTPNVLNGLQAIYQNPTPQNAQAQAMGMGLVRDDKILPSIANLCQAAMTADGSGQSSFALNAQPGNQQFMFATRTFLTAGAQGFTGFDNSGAPTNGGFNAQPPNGPGTGVVQQTIAGQQLQAASGAAPQAAAASRVAAPVAPVAGQ